MKDHDSAIDVQRLHLLAWSAIAAVVGGAAGAGFGGSPVFAIVGAALGGAGLFGAVAVLSQSTAGAAGVFLAPTGRSTPGAPEFSLAESLAARGLLAEAATEYRAQSTARPNDPQPCIRLARLHRDRLQAPSEAATWFREARRRAVDPALEDLIVHELVELYVRHMNEPVRALPELARLAQVRAGTPQGERAAAELARLKRETVRSDGDAVPLD